MHEIIRRLRAGLVAGAALVLGAAQPSAAQEQEPPREPVELEQSGTVTIQQGQVAFLASANFGGGELSYQGETYEFRIGGLGVGGIGISSVEATGEVYNLNDLADFEGAYGQARTGVVVGTAGAGELWLENPAGVYLHLESKRAGVALSMGLDAIYITLE